MFSHIKEQARTTVRFLHSSRTSGQIGKIIKISQQRVLHWWERNVENNALTSNNMDERRTDIDIMLLGFLRALPAVAMAVPTMTMPVATMTVAMSAVAVSGSLMEDFRHRNIDNEAT